MKFDPTTIFLLSSVLALIIERIFYYRLKYSSRKNQESVNPGYGERIAKLEKGQEELEKNNEKDHELIRRDIRKIFNLLNGVRK